MRVFAIAFAIFLAPAFIDAAFSQDRTFGDFNCTDDCSGHAAGYKWAETHDINDEADCPYGNSQSFHEGCIARTRDAGRGAEEDDDGNMVGMPIDRPDADDDDR